MLTLLKDQGGESFLPNCAKMPYLDQGDSNACGTTSLAMAMTYLDVPKTRQEIDRAIRRPGWPDMFTAPGDLVSYARANGLRAQDYNNGRWQNVVAEIMVGNPCICLIHADYKYPTSSGSTLHGFHYVAINGFRADKKNPPDLSVFHDPNEGGSHVDMEAVVADLEAMWDDVGWFFHNYYIALTPADGFFATIPDRSLSGAEGVSVTLGGVADLFNGIHRWGKLSVRNFFRGLGQIVAGIIETIGGGVFALIQLLGQKLKGWVDDVPILRNLVQPIGDILNAAGAAGADLVQMAGNVIDDAGRFLAHLFTGDFAGAGKAAVDAVKDVATGIMEAVSDAADGVKDAITDFFQGLFSDGAPTTGAGDVAPAPAGPTTAQKEK